MTAKIFCKVIRSSPRKKNYFGKIATNDVALLKPEPGEWLVTHKEPGQTFDEYVKENPARVDSNLNTLFLLPLGNFSPAQQQVLSLTREYVEIFFQQKTMLLPIASDAVIPDSARRSRDDGHEQLLAPFILDSMLKGKIPPHGFVMMAISEKDLYPQPSWNFVFGIASYVNRVGVSSVYRLQKSGGSTNMFLALRRLINVSSHEIGHMFTIHHCTFAKCTMNGANNLQESDGQPNRLCSECQKKLFWNIRYDNKKRLQELIAFFKRNDMETDAKLLEADL